MKNMVSAKRFHAQSPTGAAASMMGSCRMTEIALCAVSAEASRF